MSLHAHNEIPAVSVILPVRNEENTVLAAIRSALNQAYAGELEVVVADGGSTDGTSHIVESIARQDQRVRLIDNPAHSTPAGLNAAIRSATGEVIVRLDGHSTIPPGYIARAVATLRNTNADNVGGIQCAVGSGSMDTAVALAMTSRFGAGDAHFHYGGIAGPTDTVYLGTFRRDVFERFGYFNESLVRNQDYELNTRIRAGGGVVWFEPALVVDYQPRSSIRALWRQYFQYGWWKRAVLRLHPQSIRLRQLAAPLLVIALIVSAALAATPLRVLGVVVPALYGVAVLTATLAIGSRKRTVSALLLPLVFPTMHLSWGIGFLLSNERAEATDPAPDRHTR